MSKIDRERIAAVKTLQGLGYTYRDGEQWKPPLGRTIAYNPQTQVLRPKDYDLLRGAICRHASGYHGPFDIENLMNEIQGWGWFQTF